jgi:hypothetical protein
MANGPVVDPEVVARKVAAMSLGRAQARAERVRAEAALLERVSGMSLEELRRHATTRQWLCAMGECSGATEPELGRLLGLKGGAVSVHRLRKHPVTRRLVALIQDYQLQLVLKGEFGAQASARAAAPEIVGHLSELAGAQKERDGTRRGRASRDRDAIAAGQVVLDVAGVRVQRHDHRHVHQVLLEQLSDGELEALAERGEWPERFHGTLGQPGDLTVLPALPGPGVNGSAPDPVSGPRRGRSGGRG